jgi:hypothetical protein
VIPQRVEVVELARCFQHVFEEQGEGSVKTYCCRKALYKEAENACAEQSIEVCCEKLTVGIGWGTSAAWQHTAIKLSTATVTPKTLPIFKLLPVAVQPHT